MFCKTMREGWCTHTKWEDIEAEVTHGRGRIDSGGRIDFHGRRARWTGRPRRSVDRTRTLDVRTGGSRATRAMSFGAGDAAVVSTAKVGRTEAGVSVHGRSCRNVTGGAKGGGQSEVRMRLVAKHQRRVGLLPAGGCDEVNATGEESARMTDVRNRGLIEGEELMGLQGGAAGT